MFNKLVASQNKKKFWNPRTISVSVVIHALLLAGAVYASVSAPKHEKKKEEDVTFIDVQEKQPEPPKPEPPPPPPPPPPEQEQQKPPPPKGFQELIPPKEPPPTIPDVDTSAPAVDPADFSGMGTAGGTHNGVEGGTPQATAPVDSSKFNYEVAQLDEKPDLRNKSQVQSMLSRYYPRMLQDAGIGGTTMMQFVILPDGTVDESTVKVISTTHEQFSEASEKVVNKFKFKPGMYHGKPVRVLIQMPITWQPQG
jgi:protein TonB